MSTDIQIAAVHFLGLGKMGLPMAVHAPRPQTSLTQQLMQAAMAQGDGFLDYAASSERLSAVPAST